MEIEEINLRSDEVQEILTRPPGWLVRWGITVLFIIIICLFTGSYFFKYPDTINASIIITSENLPANVVARTTGRIDTIFVSEKHIVKKDQMLAYIENPAILEDVLDLKSQLKDFSTDSIHIFESTFTRVFSLGDLQLVFSTFKKALNDYNYFLTANYHNQKISVIEKQISVQKTISQKTKDQLNISQEQLESTRKIFDMDSLLFVKNVISPADFETAKSTYLQNQQNYENAKLNIDNQEISILQLEQSLFDLQQQRVEQENTLKLAVSSSNDQLLSQIKTWEQTFLLLSPIDGICSFTKYWQKDQNINMGEVLVTVVPIVKTKIIGKILLPLQGAGKVKIGQEVYVKFDNFPYMEYGTVRVKINNMSLIPMDNEQGTKAYILEVDFPNKLVTNYNKTLNFTQEMTGTAEIIIDDLSFLDRFLNPIKSVLMR